MNSATSAPVTLPPIGLQRTRVRFPIEFVDIFFKFFLNSEFYATVFPGRP